MKPMKRMVLGLILPVLILAAWWWVTTFTQMSHAILPAISEVGTTFREFLLDGTLQADLGDSLSRVIKGYAVAVVLGIAVGSAMGMWQTTYALVHPLITAVRQIPVIAWIPLIILWCGIGELSKVVVIAIAAFFPIAVNTLGGIQSLPAGYLEVARLYRLSAAQTFRKVYLPHALPQILVGLKLGLGSSWMAVVAAELIAASSGIGYRLNYARGLLRSDAVILCMLVIGVVGIVMDKLLTLVFRQLLPWKKKA